MTDINGSGPDIPMTDPSSDSASKYMRLMARYERLMEISRQLNSTLNVGTLLNQIIKAATELTQTEEASIMLIDPSSGELRFEAASNMSPGAMAAVPVPMEGSLAGWVATTGEPVLVEDTRNEKRWFSQADKVLRFNTRNLLGVPMEVHGRIIGVVEAINKIDDRPWTEEDMDTLSTLAAQAAIAIENARLFQQSDFISEMVHELRTPLAALKASTVLLLRPSLPDDRRTEIIQTMQSETERLSRMATDFLDLARLESGRSRIETEDFDMQVLAKESLEIIHHQADEKGISTELHGEAATVRGDRGKIKQVLLNFLTNAIKYNRENGEIHVTVQSAEEIDWIQVSVRDTGQGISEEHQKRMFERFFRVPGSEGTQGTGLGLAIAKRIVEAHGGRIWLESDPGVGSTFFFTLPTTTTFNE
ncbi:MAG: GAF domain-containing sensor histidine kinase [Chloroflexi bacterium]|nr:GAF domain-containing sensor histidine kinase [Chloroflexota bacterium]